ncbi:MAG: MG2 domain-containing protein, partial [Myxococcota bacterium]
MTHARSRLALIVFAVLVVLSCRKRDPDPYPVVDPDHAGPPVALAADPGLLIRLSNADGDAAGGATIKPAKSVALSAADTSKVLARLPKLGKEPDDEKEFALREASKPPPRTGATVFGAFPPKPRRRPSTSAAKGPLTVVRNAPEGDVPIAPHVSVTFSHPMVPVTSLDALAAKDVPVSLEPAPGPGKWRWIGTKTLVFEPKTRMPMATDFKVTVAKGTKSAVGPAAAAARTWTFSTPAPVVKTFVPQGTRTRLQPLMFVEFDQRIDREAVAATISLHTGSKRRHAVRIAKQAEIDGDPVVQQLASQAEDGRWLAFVPTDALPSDSAVEVRVGPNTPSAEGPKKTTAAQTFSFRTFGPMKLLESQCGYQGRCPPGTPFEIVFSNPIDTEVFDADTMVSIDPPMPGADIQVFGDRLYVRGQGKGQSTYRVKVAGSIPDEFGQRLGKAQTRRFRVSEADPNLFAPGSGLVVLDPAAGARFSVFSINHAKLAVRAWKVDPSQWQAYLKALQTANNDRRRFSPPGSKVIDTTVRPKGDSGSLVETSIDLSAALSAGKGHVIVSVEPTKRPKEPWQQQRVVAWVQATSIGLQAHIDDEELLAWATTLADGAPIAGVDVELRSGGAKGKTNADGLATLALSRGGGNLLVAKKGGDTAFLPESVWWWNPDGSWKQQSRADNLRWFVFDDRHLYRPGEEVKLKGWVRQVSLRKGGDVESLPASVKEVRYVLRDSQGNEVKKGTLKLNAFDAFDTTLTLPGTMNLGPASVLLDAKGVPESRPGARWHHSFDVQEFRRPEFEVAARLSEGPHLVGSDAVATVAATYFAGGALPNAEVTWQVRSSPGFFQPPGHDGFVFGKVVPWWMFWRSWGEPTSDPALEPKTLDFSAKTDGAGEHRLKMDFVSVNPARAMSVSAQATVMDVNRQAWTATTATVVHPASVYVGLKSERAFVQAGQSIDLDVIVADIDGDAKAGTEVNVRAVRTVWRQKKGKMVEEELDPQTCTLDSAATPMRCSLPTKEGGSYRITATVSDAKGRPNETEMTLWVAGGELPAPRKVEQETVLLIPDREEYEHGQTAKIAVGAPWSPADALVTIRRSGVVESRRVHLSGPSTTVEVPIVDAMTPSILVQVDVVGSAPRRDDDGKVDPKLPRRPAYATGSVSLSVPPRQRTLDVKVSPGVSKIEPGGSTHVDVQVVDHAGSPVDGAEVALVVVDEAVLALTGYSLPDPLAAFYGWRDPGVRDHYLRQHVLLGSAADVTAEQAPGGAGGGGDDGAEMTRSFANTVTLDEAPPAPAPPMEVAPVTTALPPKKKPAQDPAALIAVRSDFSA